MLIVLCRILAIFSIWTVFLLWSFKLPLVASLPLQKMSIDSQRAARITLLHMYNSVSFFQRLGQLTGENKARYAKRHGYDIVYSTPARTSGLQKPVGCFQRDPPGKIRVPDSDGQCWANDPSFDIDHSRAPTFGKIQLALAACKGRLNAWILWTDADAMIINQTVRLETIIDDAYDIIFSYDWLMLNAGVLLVKCSKWGLSFLQDVYNAREFDSARALDQSALQHFVDKLSAADHRAHIKVIPKYAMDVYTEEYRPGDFLLHFAGKLYEATEPGLFSIANQFDILSMLDDVEDIRAFFRGHHFLNYYSGVCRVKHGERQSHCNPSDPRRITLNESLGSMSEPNRYRHVGLRYYWLGDWKDKYDVRGWDVFSRRLRTVPKANRFKIHSQPPPVAHDADTGIMNSSAEISDQINFQKKNVKDAGEPRNGNRNVNGIEVEEDVSQQKRQNPDTADDFDGNDSGKNADNDDIEGDIGTNDDDNDLSETNLIIKKEQDELDIDSGVDEANIGKVREDDDSDDDDEDDDKIWSWQFWMLSAVGVVVCAGIFIAFRQRKKLSSKSQ